MAKKEEQKSCFGKYDLCWSGYWFPSRLLGLD